MTEPSNQQVAPFPVDLQVHSTCSDGTDAPAELVARAARLGIRVLSLTDHDSVLGVDDAIAAGRERGVQIVPALEFSTLNEPERDFQEINVLAYGIRYQDPALTEILDRVIQSRIQQKIDQVERLQSYGVHVPVDEVLAEAGGVPGRVHIATVALRHNSDRFDSISDVFDQYLATGATYSTYVRRTFSLRVEETIEITHAAGGIAVLAHPGIYARVRDVDGVLRRLTQAGLDGIEINYTYAQNRGKLRGAPVHEVQRLIDHFDALADKLKLLKTGGSDYHGTTKPGIEIGMAGLDADGWRSVAARLGFPEELTDR